MKKHTQFFWRALLLAGLVSRALGEEVRTLDLSRFAGHSPVVPMNANWLLPQGRAVLDGVPFQIDGSLLLFATNSTQQKKPGWTNVTDIFVGGKFEVLHMLAGADVVGTNIAPVARVRFLYADGSDAALELIYGELLRGWQAPWHKEEEFLAGTNARVVWTRQNSTAAQSDKFLRLFHVRLMNPAPEKEVRTLALESAGTEYGLLLVAASVGPATAEKLPDTVAPAKNPFPDLRPRHGDLASAEGWVKNPEGKPLAGALVRVMAAREFNKPDGQANTDDPAVGTGTITDSEGHFVLSPMPDNRLYRLLVTAEGYNSQTYRGVDPKSDAVEIRLKTLPGNAGGAKISLHGRVMGPGGMPLAYATIEPDGVGTSAGSSWGGTQGFPDMVLSDTNGEFAIGRAEPFVRLQLEVSAPGLARERVWLDLTNTSHIIRLDVGASVRGRVLKDGQPLAGVSVGISGKNRDAEVYAGHFEAKTDTNGNFVFQHLPPDTAWELYGIMDAIRTYGALPAVMMQTEGHGKETDAGDMKVIPAMHLAGQVKTRYGDPLPKGIKVTLGYEGPWDYQTVPVDKDGRFILEGLWPGEIDINTEPRDWHLTWANRSMDWLNPFRLTGLVAENKDDLMLIIEKGAYQYNNYWNGNGQLPQQDQSNRRPIQGAESSGAPPITLAGRVVDDATGQPILKYKVVPGYKPYFPNPRPVGPNQRPLLSRLFDPSARNVVPYNERIFWIGGHSDSVTNGIFAMDFAPLSSLPVVRIEAPGYEPEESEPTNVTTTNIVVRLKQGVGPNGVVLLPNGKPAAGALVVYGINQEQFTLMGTVISAYGQSNSIVTVGSDGKFSFPPRLEGATIFISDPAGWAAKSLGRGSVAGLSIELQPWAWVAGTLVDTNNAPVAGVELELTVYHDWQKSGAMLNLNLKTKTDASGNFAFTNVPPGRLELQRTIPFTPGGGMGSGWTYRLQTRLVASPGITNDLGKVTFDHPPPESAFDVIKTRLGL